jgi:hypothetical protein
MDHPFPAGPVLAHALLTPDAPAHELVRTALLHLAALGFVRAQTETRSGMFKTGSAVRLHRGDGRGPLPAELAPVLEALYPPDQPPRALERTELVHRLQQRFGYDYGRYRSRHVRPALVERGWLVEETSRTLWIVPRRRFLRTEEGARLKIELDTRLQPAAEAAARVPSDPHGALRVVAALGPLALVSEALRPHLPALAGTARAEGAPLPAEMFTTPEEEEERRTAWMDALGMLSEIDWAGVLEALDGFGDAGADGGGDGGGGGE